ncbi:uroporphyrinogen-III C-methyltransferase [Tepidamorphus gemmatus]|uniref:Uroporphyrinogen-III C-methyltransferase n=1 Tax=Tepidamorphus gemmatus TaxID=747076 RepID=A0A4R3M0D7_9HYPH|nr:siroheme synthase CysG [Tepidamorphus gemmatus]TCT06442.1 uroporphyrinogen-III C-methyltransferase [Tepidamorphus gemmatus]
MGALKTFPVSTVVEGRRVVVAGGGEAAEAKLRLLAKTAAEVHVFSPHGEPPLLALAAAEGYPVHARWPDAADFAGAALAFIAAEDADRDRALAATARSAGVPVNVVDRPEMCDVLTPAIVDRAPVTIAISTEGAAPVLTSILRARIEAMLTPGLGLLAGVASSLRDRVADLLPPGARRLSFWRRYFTSCEFADAATRGAAEVRRRALRLLEEERGAAPSAGFVWLVGAGPGAADLLTLRARNVLAEADVVVFDSLVDAGVMDVVRRDARRIDVGKRKGRASVTQDQINAILIAEAAAGNRVVRLKAGDPMIYGRAGEEIAALREAGIAHAVVPGITAALGAAAETAMPLTHRRLASTLVFATGHAAPGEEGLDWAQIARSDATVSLYMAKSVAGEVAGQLMANGLSPDTAVGAVENACRPDQRRFYGRLDELAGLAGRGDVSGPVVIFVGPAVAEGDWTGAEAFAPAAVLAA